MLEFDVISPPDESARRAALTRHERLTKPRGSLGRLEELGVWLAACQGQCPPRPPARPRVVVFAGDHGVAGRGVSAFPSEVTGQMVANFQAGGAAINVLASVAGAGVRVVDLAVAVDTGADRHKVRRSSGSIDVEDALSEEEVRAALAAGRAIADEEVDAGADLLVAGDMGIGNTTPAATLVAALTGTEPVAVVGRGTGIDDATWMRKTAAIRDAMRRAKPVTADPVALLRTVAGADIAAMAAFLAQAAVRRTPVVLDGLVSGAAALVAEELAPGARAWWVAGHRSTEPAHTLVLEQLDLRPLLELGMRLGEGSGAVAAIPLLTMAGRVLAEMATFEDAGVSDQDGGRQPELDATPLPERDTAEETTAETAAAETAEEPADGPGTGPTVEPGAGLEVDALPPTPEPDATPLPDREDDTPAADATPLPDRNDDTPPPDATPLPDRNDHTPTPDATPLPDRDTEESAPETGAGTSGAPAPEPLPEEPGGTPDQAGNEARPEAAPGDDAAPLPTEPGDRARPATDPDR